MRIRGIAAGLVLSGALVVSAGAQVEKAGITHTQLLRADLAGVPAKELIVFDTRYAPNAINPKHYHTSQITFYVLEGSGIWQEEGKVPVTLNSGSILMVTPGTVH
ncbi:MAG: cupin domain-containing protein, partial [Alphaproteobacteria bacterium]